MLRLHKPCLVGWVVRGREAFRFRQTIFWAEGAWTGHLREAKVYPSEFEAATALLELCDDPCICQEVKDSLQVKEVF